MLHLESTLLNLMGTDTARLATQAYTHFTFAEVRQLVEL